MANPRKPSRLPMPGLFDSLDDFNEGSESDFSIIPDKKMDEIARKYRREQPAIDELPEFQASDRIFFMSFGSGSSGNCSYIGDRSGGFLIDAGVEVAKVVEGLRRNGISMDHVAGICRTHDHGDHMKYVYQIVRKYRHIPVYCTPKTFNGLLRRHSISRRIKDYHSPIYKEFPFKIGNFEVTAFDVSHDGTDNAGFFIAHGGGSIAVATDLGNITGRVDYYMRQAQFIVIEANYDAAMLRDGHYPEYLKARIAADNGHLDNMVTAGYLASIYNPGIRAVFLCHLSHDNNTPETAMATMINSLRSVSVVPATSPVDIHPGSVYIAPLPRFKSSELYVL